jgi:hypothetical protein
MGPDGLHNIGHLDIRGAAVMIEALPRFRLNIFHDPVKVLFQIHD